MRVDAAALIAELRGILGTEVVLTDSASLQLMASDLYVSGALPLAVIRPSDDALLGQAVAAITAAGASVVPRGGGLSYTGGYACEPARSVVVDLSALNRIEHISAQDMYAVAQAGVTWRQLHEALTPLGLRLPYFGTFSGAGASIGGGLSHGALFFGSARHGSAADIALGMEVITADGTRLRTGQWALKVDAAPVFRNFGPDTTGLFTHDGGAFGLKTRAALRLIPLPAHTGFASFAFSDFEAAASALSAIARAGLAEEVYVLDAGAVAVNTERERSVAAAWRAMWQVLGTARGIGEKISALTRMAAAGRRVIPEGAFTLHMVAAGNCRAAVKHDIAQAQSLAAAADGVRIAATVPRIARANPFPGLNAVLGAHGERWAALNAKVAHSRAGALIHAHQQLIARHQQMMEATGVRVTYLCSALCNYSFSFEAVFHWRDAWLPLHEAKVDATLLAGFTPSAANLTARALVAQLREETCALFAAQGAASNQIGRTYPFLDVLDEAPVALLRELKQHLDPARRMNPGVLGL